jgi:hypothetical protein
MFREHRPQLLPLQILLQSAVIGTSLDERRQRLIAEPHHSMRLTEALSWFLLRSLFAARFEGDAPRDMGFPASLGTHVKGSQDGV